MAVVLVTEDEPVIRAFACVIVHDLGHQSVEAASVDDALELLSSDRPIDVLFTDINLRPLAHGGLQLARKAIELRPKLGVIYTTGRELSDEMRAMFIDGAPFLPKPYTPDTFSTALSEAMLPKANG